MGHARVCKLANAMKARGVGKGDRVTLYLPMIPEAAVAMLACARIGAIHSIVFGGFSPDALGDRIKGCEAKCVITADEGMEKFDVETCIVVKRTGGDINMKEGRDLWY